MKNPKCPMCKKKLLVYSNIDGCQKIFVESDGLFKYCEKETSGKLGGYYCQNCNVCIGNSNDVRKMFGVDKEKSQKEVRRYVLNIYANGKLVKKIIDKKKILQEMMQDEIN